MPLTTYTAGDVLTASSLNANLSFAAGNTVGGMVFLHGSNFSAATSISLPNSTFSNDFDNYKLFITLSAVTSNASFTMRFRTAGTNNTTANYGTQFMGLSELNVVSNEVTAGANTSIKLGESASGGFGGLYGLTLDVINPFVAKFTLVFGHYTFVDVAPTAQFVRTGSGKFQGTTSFDSLSFISSVASNISGTIYCFGYNN